MKKTFVASLILATGLFLASMPNVVNAQTAVKKVVKTQQIDKSYYTCPMHPQVKQEKAGKCPVCGMALVEKKVQVKKTVRMQQVQDSTLMKRQHMMKKGGEMRIKRDSMMKKGNMMKSNGVRKMKKDTAMMKRKMGM